MKLIVIGRADEVIGFTLAGVETVACDAAADAAGVVEGVAVPATDAGLVLVSPWIARHAAGAIAGIRQRKGPPVVTIMPGFEERP